MSVMEFLCLTNASACEDAMRGANGIREKVSGTVKEICVWGERLGRGRFILLDRQRNGFIRGLRLNRYRATRS